MFRGSSFSVTLDKPAEEVETLVFSELIFVLDALWNRRGGTVCDVSERGHAECNVAPGALHGDVKLGRFAVSSGEADLQVLDLAKPTLALGLDNAGDEIVTDLLETWPLRRIWPGQGASDAGVLMNSGGVESACTGADRAAGAEPGAVRTAHTIPTRPINHLGGPRRRASATISTNGNRCCPSAFIYCQPFSRDATLNWCSIDCRLWRPMQKMPRMSCYVELLEGNTCTVSISAHIIPLKILKTL